MSGSPTPALASFEKMLAAGKDGALLRFSLGNEYLKAGDAARAAEHLARAVALDPKYTAAWKLYGKALAAAGRDGDALAAYRAASPWRTQRGDKQAEKEMQVFARRLGTSPGSSEAWVTVRPEPIDSSTPRLASASARSLPAWSLWPFTQCQRMLCRGPRARRARATDRHS